MEKVKLHRCKFTWLKTEGLSDAAAATPSCPPSILTLTGLVRHMTEVERNWFRRCFAGEPLLPIAIEID